MMDFLPKILKLAAAFPTDWSLQSLAIFPGADLAQLRREQNDAMQSLLANLSGHCGLFAQAVYLAQDNACKNPSNFTAQYELAMAHLLCGDYPQAITKFLSTRHMLKHYRVAMCYRLQGNKSKAREFIGMLPADLKRDPKVMAESGLIERMV